MTSSLAVGCAPKPVATGTGPAITWFDKLEGYGYDPALSRRCRPGWRGRWPGRRRTRR